VHLLHKRGKSLRTIASALGRSKSTIARALSEPVDRQSESRRRKSNVDPFRDQIAEWLKQGLSGVRMMELEVRPTTGVVRSHPVLNGLHHVYERAA
jgi:IS30 family transposase